MNAHPAVTVLEEHGGAHAGELPRGHDGHAIAQQVSLGVVGTRRVVEEVRF